MLSYGPVFNPALQPHPLSLQNETFVGPTLSPGNVESELHLGRAERLPGADARERP